jgi:hypothetical protein
MSLDGRHERVNGDGGVELAAEVLRMALNLRAGWFTIREMMIEARRPQRAAPLGDAAPT